MEFENQVPEILHFLNSGSFYWIINTRRNIVIVLISQNLVGAIPIGGGGGGGNCPLAPMVSTALWKNMKN